MHRGVVTAAPALKDFVETELKRLDLPPSRLALVGFSQGTMMALHLGRAILKPAAIIGFSGVLTGEVPPATDFPPVFLSHGSADPVIPPEALFATAAMLGTAGVRVQWHLSSGVGHGIDDDALSQGANFLKLAFGGRLAAQGPCRSLLK
jgi:phospholipase/carboxylesterase